METAKEYLWRKARIRFIEKGDRLYYDDHLDLRDKNIEYLPDNITVKYDLMLEWSSMKRLPKGLIVGGCLNAAITGDVGLPEGLRVGGYLNLKWTNISTLPENLVVSAGLIIDGTKISSIPNSAIIKGDLYLWDTEVKHLPKGLTILGTLNIKGGYPLELPEGLVVGEGLYLTDSSITSLPKDITVGGEVEIENTNIPEEELKKIKTKMPDLITWGNGRFLNNNGKLVEVLEHRGKVYKVRNPFFHNVYYVVSDGKGRWADGDTIKEAKKYLLYTPLPKDLEEYKHLTLDTVLPAKEALEAYMNITESYPWQVVRFFKENPDIEIKETYTVSELLEITKNHFSNRDFRKFLGLV